jgi:hypothetical protein
MLYFSAVSSFRETGVREKGIPRGLGVKEAGDLLESFEAILVDAETHDFPVKRLAGNSQLGGCPRWARDSAPALRERFFDHLPLAIFERRHQRNDRTGCR